jgi:ATP-dependent Lhr-like helicase
MEDLRDEQPWLDDCEDNLLVAVGGELTWWTFAGGRANAALASELSRRLELRVTGDNLAVRFQSPPDVLAVERTIAALRDADADVFAPAVSEAARDGLKFSECLPTELADRVIRARLSDPIGVAEALGRRTRNIAVG